MSPLRGILGRIAGRRPEGEPADAAKGKGGRAAANSTSSQKPSRSAASARSGQSARQAQTTTTKTQERAAPQGGRGSSRGGRGRGSGGETNGAAKRQTEAPDTAARGYAWGKKVGDDAEARKVLDDRRRDRMRRRGRSRPAGKLDAPLPEDIAFRAADEGGDRSILPARRRKPKGLRTTERVLVGGSHALTGVVGRSFDTDEKAEAAPTPARAPRRPAPTTNGAADHAEPEDHEEAPEREPEAVATVPGEEPPTKRRRGRRGGRGRRRPGADGAAADHAESPEAGGDDADPEDHEDEPAAEAAPAPAREPAPTPPPVAAPAPRARRARAEVAEADLPAAFAGLGLQRTTLEQLARYGFADPTPIQERAIPELLAGGDVVGVAKTGSGKTIAFGAPMVERLDPERREVQAIVLVPTRELAQQVLEVIGDLGEPYGLEAIGLLGGRALNRDFKALERNPHIVVGTPGRIIDHLTRRTLSLRAVRYAVLDEADQMLDIGFLPDIRRILGRTPRARQTALFSATMPTTIKRLIYQFMRDPVTCSVDPELSTVESIRQVYVEVASRDKVRGLKELVERELKGRTLVFCKMKRGVDRVERQLADAGVRVGALHGDMDQSRRDRVVQDFRQGKLDILIATNVAARGLDIPEITHVVNFDFPQNLEEYVHRIGRTGRAGRDGKAITFVCEDDLEALEELKGEFGAHLEAERLELY